VGGARWVYSDRMQGLSRAQGGGGRYLLRQKSSRWVSVSSNDLQGVDEVWWEWGTYI